MAPDQGIDFDNQVHIGYPVVALDGEELGQVADAMQLYFQVAGEEGAYWLPMELIESTIGERVTLSVNSDSLDDYRMEMPPAAA